ncbi:phenolic acid decarboxylase, partial [Streptomyces flaveolus]
HDLWQVMWAMSSKVNPAGDVMILPNLSVVELAPAAQPAGLTSKMIIDATTPVHPDTRGNFSTPAKDLPEAKDWAARLRLLLSEARG